MSASGKRRAGREMNYADLFHDVDDADFEDPASPDHGGAGIESAPTTKGVGNAQPPKRKRQKLTHLTQDEKMMRRKLKNRMAAQSARDRKKAQMDDLEKIVIRLEKQNAALMKENQTLRASISSSTSSASSSSSAKTKQRQGRPASSSSPESASSSSSLLTRELLDRISSSSSSESAAFGSVLPQQERTAAWVRRQLLFRLSTATRCFTCLITLMLTSSLRSRMLSSVMSSNRDEAKTRTPLTPQEKRVLLRLHVANQALVSCCHQRRRQTIEEGTARSCWWGPQQQSWNPARISATAEA